LRGKSAAAATLSMATSPAVTMMTIFMMLIPLCWAPGRADRVTPLFRLSVRDARFYHPMFRLNRRGKWLPTICRFGDGMVQMRLGGSGRTQINQMVSRQHGRQRWRSPGSLPLFYLLGSSLRVSNYRRRAECAPRLPSERRRSRPPHGTAVGGNQTHLPASATNEVVELGTARVSAFASGSLQT